MKKRSARLLAAAFTTLAVAAPAALANPSLLPALPGDSTSPTINSVGATEVGADLACTTGAWIGNGPIAYAFRWSNNGTPIAGATTDNYVVQTADAGDSIVCSVTATDVDGSTTEDSDPVTPGTAPPTMALTQYSPHVTWAPFPPSFAVGANLKRGST